tara:strand:+ start:597 stop:1289 length:693 start_codon:yes stop_codon:yes gene_type:complete
VRVSIVIPALNEAATIGSVVNAVREFGHPIVVDDGSDDGTSDIATAAGATIVRHDLNAGYDAAIESGFKEALRAAADIVVTFDADGQHDAQLVPKMFAPFEAAEIELVIGVRDRSARLSEVCFNQYARWRYGIGDILCGLKAYRIGLYRTHGPFDATPSIGTGMALRALQSGARFEMVDVPITRRRDQARIGSAFRANMSILGALGATIAADLTNTVRTGGRGHDRMSTH